ncbi:serine/threonine-protein phosphatase 2A regulatory subunit B'' subunit beta [Dipodomys spectabilis]|uniref:serine/threonine-protein phosphatase 2A regulatory subunit B'' subunit beta n=1 Tax=Dipodomys spectabilis TaxID=105255 RepID=UPI001C548388|nr:serine/threonine-protein phosphatase 2A regulatory subunit B'' subunit beta [Dipodomys spectabilis]
MDPARPRWLRPPPQAEPRPAAGVGGRGSWRAAAPDLRGELALLARGGDLVLPSRVRRRLRAAQQAQSRRAAPPSPPPPAGSRRIPSFHFPLGRPPPRAGDVDAGIARVEAAFARLPQERATARDMGAVAKACGCPLYWKAPLFYAAGGDRAGSVSVHKFVAVWRKILHTCHDDAARFVHLLMGPGCNYLVPEDFVPFLQDVVNTHPGLSFLKEASEFHSRYITTVIQRIFYTVNRSWSGRITCTELRRSSFLQNVALLEEEADINQLTEFFSYEHFYVIYCKFWELDTDHDLLIDARDLARHADHAISTRMIDRIFSGAVTRGRRAAQGGKLSYADFVWFLISEEDKRSPTSIEYWFRCMDLDGDGVLSMFELEFFYEEQRRRLRALGLDPLPFHDCLCQMLDLVRPAHSPCPCPPRAGRITLRDLKRCRLAPEFFDTFFNLEKYLQREQREQAWLLRDGEAGRPEASDWDRFAAAEYDALLAEDDARDAG